MVLPASFIPAYGDPHLRHLSDFVVSQAGKDCGYFTEGRSIDIAINLPIALLHEEDCCEFLCAATSGSAAAGALLLEVSSAEVIRDLAFALRRHGISTRACGTGALQISPTFVMSDAQVDDLANGFRAALDEL